MNLKDFEEAMEFCDDQIAKYEQEIYSCKMHFGMTPSSPKFKTMYEHQIQILENYIDYYYEKYFYKFVCSLY
jgi:hypothetical protein